MTITEFANNFPYWIHPLLFSALTVVIGFKVTTWRMSNEFKYHGEMSMRDGVWFACGMLTAFAVVCWIWVEFGYPGVALALAWVLVLAGLWIVRAYFRTQIGGHRSKR